MSEKILVVDDDDSILDFAQHVLRDIGCQVVIMNNPVAALEYLGREEVAVLVSDNNMPVMHGLELIEKANSASSETVKILMSAYTDLPMALCAINKCQVFKFVTKPWESKDMFDTVTDALRRYHTLQILRRENENVLYSLAQTVELKDLSTRGHCDRVAALAGRIARILDLSTDMQREIKYGSWLHDCGKIGIPEQVLNANRKLEAEEYELIKKHPGWGADVARKANLSAVIINVILCHHEHFDGTGYPMGLCGEDIPIEARVVSVADVFDALSTDRPYRKGLSLEESLEIVVSMKGKELDPALVDLFLTCEAFIAKEDEQNHGGEILSKDQNGVNKLILNGDFSIAGVNEQLSILAQHLAGVAGVVPGTINRHIPYEVDARGVQVLDTCGCQLLAVLLRSLRQRGIESFSLKFSDDDRDKIRSLGFAEEIFAGECS
jgi:response regulator RpfG family c-di-GMP phosphodiesterase